MLVTQTHTLTRANTIYLVKFLALLVVATAAPALGFHSQWITGPIVNAVLIASVFIVGIRGAFLIGLLPSTIALAVGLLPPVLAPMIPFIIISNTLLILVIDQLKNKYWLGLVLGSTLKFIFLLTTSSLASGLLLKKELSLTVAQMMSWPQLFTALIGGCLVYLILKIKTKNT